ncbi:MULTISPECIES: hypothetical protein [Nitrospirillum]|uniref:Uncharacterized protein n=1 Tax=Nitrospirillum amazonense TaxID=28077 RepID=A0A560FG43_9PROT|nr:hypothetical protein [Nitrospirillum amazonense]MEC4594159.1 hypothetical protein [Nitrospirillum amazonense]TWB20558.1 hypothetical protein FBZ88_12152 [Nitrospirillum amazonense]
MTPSVQSALSPSYPDPALAGGNATAATAGQAGMTGDFQDQLGQQVAQDATQQAGALPGQVGSAPVGTAAAVQAQAAAHKDNHMSFWDVVDIINPLQHIPVISTIYREITGDTIKAPAKILGGLLYGGPIGMALATGDAIIEEETGEDVGGHVMDALGLGHHKTGTVTLDPDEDQGGGKGRQGGHGDGQEQPDHAPDQAPTAGRAPVAKVESLVLAPQTAGAAPAVAQAAPVPGQMVRTSSVPAGAVPGLATPATTVRSQGQAFPNLAAVPAMAVNAPAMASPGAVPGANPSQALAQQASQITNATQAMAQAANAAANIGVSTQSMPMAAGPQLMPAQAAAMARPASNEAGTHLGQKQAHGLTLANYRAMAGAGAGAPTGRTLVAPSYVQNIKSATAGPTVLQTGAVQANAAQSQAVQSQAALAAASHPAMIQVMDGGTAATAQPQRTPVPQAIQAYTNAMGQDTATLLAQATAASASINGSQAPTGAQPAIPQQPGGVLSASAMPPAGATDSQAASQGGAAQTGAAVISNATGGPPPLPKQFIADIMMANLAKYQAMKDAQGAAH